MPRTVALFLGDGFVGLDTVNRVIPSMVDMGLAPILFCIGGIPFAKSKIPELADVNFYGGGILDAVIPYLNARAPIAANDNNPRKDLLYTVKHLSQIFNLACHQVADVNDPAFVRSIKDNPDIVGGLCISMHRIFKKDIIEAFNERDFFWSLHRGKLPEYKGVVIPYREIFNRESTSGWSLYRIDERIDTGRILGVAQRPLDPRRPILETYLDVSPHAAAMIVGALRGYLEHGPPAGHPQTSKDNDPRHYYSFPTAAEMLLFNACGLRFADPWRVPDLIVDRFSMRGTDHALALRDVVIQEIATYEHTKEARVILQGYHDAAPCGA